MIHAVNEKAIREARRAYFIGIGGSGMSALARLLHTTGVEVAGSDLMESRTTRQLVSSGIPVFIGQKEARLDPTVDLVVYSSAISESHIEFQAARRFGLPMAHRAVLLSSLFNSAPTSVAVTGTHGKTTTSSMVAFVLKDLGRDPTCMIGGEIMDYGTNALIGRSGIYVSEVDESDQTHELFTPNYAIITNLEEEHVERYHSAQELEASFERFLSNLHDPGFVVYSSEDKVLQRLVQMSGRPHLSFGLSLEADFSAQNIELTPEGSTFDLFECGIFVTEMHLAQIGLHNVTNALGCMALLIQMGLSPEAIAGSLAHFHGAKRRLEVKYRSDRHIVINDYAHNPTKVMAAVKALKIFGKPVTLIFQPHRFTRTARFYREFALSLADCTELVLTDVYAAGEINESCITTQDILEEVIRRGHPRAHYLPKHEIVDFLSHRIPSEGVIAFLGAGDIGEIANEFADRFRTFIPV